ncbi:hypothetical protein [Parasulfuritortus cantonensis]|uniref:hypothetical protein n=1 Tax=Parasulfuritortus cantonensis TaxID=2528202 RepID=UPI001404953F|nr:hypothetical protein [Parasulfuritortus cantonensis]
MNTFPEPDKRVAALLAQAGLGHWRSILCEMFRRYEGLQDLTIGMNEGARPEVVALLRMCIRSGVVLDDRAFAHAIAGLGFLDYRIHRANDRTMLDERWDPALMALSEFRAAGPITAYPAATRPLSPALTARHLLRQLRQHGDR